MSVGNPRGGRTAAILASLTSTCRRHDIDPQLYLTQLLINLPSARTSELTAWLPDQWKLISPSRLLHLYPFASQTTHHIFESRYDCIQAYRSAH
jgi:hypothetical protein